MPWHPAVPATPYYKAPACSTPRRESAAHTPPKATGGLAWHIAKAGHRSRLLRLWRRLGVAGCRRQSRRRWLPLRMERAQWRWLERHVSSTRMRFAEYGAHRVSSAGSRRRSIASPVICGSWISRRKECPISRIATYCLAAVKTNRSPGNESLNLRSGDERVNASIRAAGRFDMPTHRPTHFCTPGPRNFSALHDVTSGALRYEYDHSVLSHVTFGKETLRNSNAHD